MARWRTMLPNDLPAAEAMGSAFHIHHPEGPNIAPERLGLAGDFCLVLEGDDGTFQGYCVAHPWGGPLPPALDTLVGRLPQDADGLHIHDVVLDERTRGKGHAGELLDILTRRATQHGLVRLTLVAVGGAGRYWNRQGFFADPDPVRIEYVRKSYGEDGTPMLRPVEPTAAA